MRVRYSKDELYRALEPVGWDIGDSIRMGIVSVLGEEKHWVTGELALSYTVETKYDSSGVSIEVYSPLVKAIVLERGSRPHNAPFARIYRWAMLKIAPVEGVERARAVARRVWDAIRTRGNKAHSYIDRGVWRGLDNVERKYRG